VEEAVEILHNEVNYLYIFLRSYSDLEEEIGGSCRNIA